MNDELERLIASEPPSGANEIAQFSEALKDASRGINQSSTLKAVIQGFDDLVVEASQPVNDSDAYGEIRQSEKDARIKAKTLFLIKHLQHFK